MSEILVTGGAGYIGSATCKHLKKIGYQPVAIDSLVTGHRQAVQWGPLFEGSLEDTALLDDIFTRHRPAAVMHFAASCYVNESVRDPLKYYRNNVAATTCLLDAMCRHHVTSIIFSSSCATYGEPVELPITETHVQNPINPYGRSKLMIEQILKDMDAVHGLRYVSLRYFNAAGADPEGRIGEDHQPEPHLIPLVLQTALGRRENIHIFGDDYPTRDGTCVRDYIHIDDLARAHLLALVRLMDGRSSAIYNLGNGGGYSVREVIDTAREVTGQPIPATIAKRRAGDPAELISSSEKALTELGWKPEFTKLRDIIATAWEWHQRHPDGYVD
ncbi:MAG: UDP-glucose 4-epimerase GalE [Thermodesulfobacteriota bacterium]